MPSILQVTDVHKSYVAGQCRQPVLQGISLTVQAGEFVAIVGPSGNGKSTLLNLCAGIDKPCSGSVLVGDRAIHRMTEEQLAIWRGRNLGIVFQFFQLLPSLSLVQNVMLPMDFAAILPRRQRRARAMELLDRVGLSALASQLPSQVSGGEQQRAAIARALANDPPLLVADEPTGNLDARTASDVFQLFAHLADQGKTLVMVTHNEELAGAASRRVEIRCGRVHSDSALAATSIVDDSES